MRFTGLAILLICLNISVLAQTSRSYMEKEIIGQSVHGPISEVPTHEGTWVEWDSSEANIIMMDGSRWQRTKSVDGFLHYKYSGTNGQPQKFTVWHEAIFSADWTKMKIRYSFGMPGMLVPMVGIYNLLGDGKQLAIDWINMPDDE